MAKRLVVKRCVQSVGIYPRLSEAHIPIVKFDMVFESHRDTYLFKLHWHGGKHTFEP